MTDPTYRKLHTRLEGILSRSSRVLCPVCNGDGYTAEHAGDMSCMADEHAGCPVQVQCDYCEAKGWIEDFTLADVLMALWKLRILNTCCAWNDEFEIRTPSANGVITIQLNKDLHQQQPEVLEKLLTLLKND